MDRVTVRPTARSFIRYYLESLTPLIILLIVEYFTREYPALSVLSYLFIILGVLVVAWVLRSRFTVFSTGLFIIIIILLVGFNFHNTSNQVSLDNIVKWLNTLGTSYFLKVVRISAIISSILSVLYAEGFRRSIRYIVDKGGVTIVGGLLRKQEVFYTFTQVSNVVIERGLIGRLLGYGSVILVSTGGWGNEMYTRMVGAGGTSHHAGIGVGYARTLQEVSRDPLKCLYGIPHPEEIGRLIQSKLSFTYEALEKQVSLLEDISKKISK